MSNINDEIIKKDFAYDLGLLDDLGILLSNQVVHGRIIHDERLGVSGVYTRTEEQKMIDNGYKWRKPQFKMLDRSQGRLKRFTLKTIQAIVDYLQQYRIFKV